MPRRTSSDKVLRDIAVNVVKNWNYDEYQGGIISLVYRFFGKKVFC